MKVWYKNRKVEKIFSDERELKKHYEKQVAEKIGVIIDRLKVADNLRIIDDQKSWRVHELSGMEAGLYSLDITGLLRLIVQPNVKFPNLANRLDTLALIDEITIIGVKDTHEGKIRRK